MKKPFYYLSIATSSLLVVGCTPALQTPRAVTQPRVNVPITQRPITYTPPTVEVSQKTPQREIETIVKAEPVIEVKREVQTQEPKPKRPIYNDPTESQKNPQEPTKSVEEIDVEVKEVEVKKAPLIVIPTETTKKEPQVEPKKDPYGNPPQDYRDTIRAYLNKKSVNGESIKYIFSRPKKAEKKSGSWQGWMVQVDVLKRNGKGVVIRKQPYTILFKESKIVEDIAEENAKGIKVVY